MDTTPAPAPAPVAEKTTRKTTRKPLMAPPAPPKPLPAHRATGAAEAAKEKNPTASLPTRHGRLVPVYLKSYGNTQSRTVKPHGLPTCEQNLRFPPNPYRGASAPPNPTHNPTHNHLKPPQSGYSAADDLRLLREAARAINMKEVRLVAIKLRNCTDCFERALIMADHGRLIRTTPVVPPPSPKTHQHPLKMATRNYGIGLFTRNRLVPVALKRLRNQANSLLHLRREEDYYIEEKKNKLETSNSSALKPLTEESTPRDESLYAIGPDSSLIPMEDMHVQNFDYVPTKPL
ncbi:hypothetical protein ACJJTC_010621 [Scirpophaga incertulas]